MKLEGIKKSAEQQLNVAEQKSGELNELTKQEQPLRAAMALSEAVDDEQHEDIENVSAVHGAEKARASGEYGAAVEETLDHAGQIEHARDLMEKQRRGVERIRETGLGARSAQEGVGLLRSRMDETDRFLEEMLQRLHESRPAEGSDDLPSAAAGDRDWTRTASSPEELRILAEMERSGELEIPTSAPYQGDMVRETPHMPKSGGWLERGEDRFFVPEKAEARAVLERFGQEGVCYRENEPDFSPFVLSESPWGTVNGQVEIPHMTVYRQNPKLEGERRPRGTSHDPLYELGNFAQAENALLEKLHAEGKHVSMKELLAWIDESKLSWHECADGKTMQLIPTALHSACPHSGGVSEMRYRSSFGGVEYDPEYFI